MWVLYAFLSATTAALVAVFGKIGLSKIDSNVATTVRSIVMAVLLVVFSLFFIEKFRGFSVHDWSSRQWLFVILSGAAGALSWLFYFAALKNGPASKVVAIDRLSLVMVFVLAILFLGETFRWKGAVGAVLMVGGAILLSIK